MGWMDTGCCGNGKTIGSGMCVSWGSISRVGCGVHFRAGCYRGRRERRRVEWRGEELWKRGLQMRGGGGVSR